MDVFEKVYYMRAMAGAAAGVIVGFAIPVGFDQNTSISMVVGIAIVSYIISVAIGKSIAKNVPNDKRKKVAMDGVIPFIFLLLVFMILVYTALHQSIVS